MKLNNKGMAISGIMYSILILFLVLLFGILAIVASTKFTYDNIKKSIINKLDGIAAEDYIDSSIGYYAKNLLVNNTTYGNYTYMGGTYLKGIQTSNYVWFNGFLWRIMGINEDGTVRMITDENVAGIPWGNAYSSTYTSSGYINDWLNDYFYDRLNNTKKIISNQDFCYQITTDKLSQRTTCSESDKTNEKVGLITLDEYNLSGTGTTREYYLNIGQDVWTMTRENSSNTWNFYSNGVTDSISYYAFGIRPVINVYADTSVSDGDGTLQSVYLLSQADSDSSIKGKEIAKEASVGEYVLLNKKYFRISGIESQGVKLIYDGYYTTGTTFGSNSTYDGSNVDNKIINDVLPWLGLDSSDKLVDASWNPGTTFDLGNSYNVPLTSSGEDIIRKAGVLKTGEILSNQSSSILNDGYKDSTGFDNSSYAKTFWIMTRSGGSDTAWYASDSGHNMWFNVTNTYYIRPVIYLKRNEIIASGYGTYKNPYVIE